MSSVSIIMLCSAKHLNQDRNKHRSRKQFEMMDFVVRGREINFFIGIINIKLI